NRQWAIDQLGQRPADAAAVAALAEAATGADYFRTRAGAVEALGAVPAANTAAPLAAALRDTSAQVRRASVAALGQLGGARAAEPGQVGVPGLQPGVGTLKYPDTRKDVETALRRLQKPATDDE